MCRKNRGMLRQGGRACRLVAAGDVDEREHLRGDPCDEDARPRGDRDHERDESSADPRELKDRAPSARTPSRGRPRAAPSG